MTKPVWSLESDGGRVLKLESGVVLRSLGIHARSFGWLGDTNARTPANSLENKS
jgi:hypothetical protein